MLAAELLHAISFSHGPSGLARLTDCDSPARLEAFDGVATRWGIGLTCVCVSPGSHSHCLGTSRQNWIHSIVQHSHVQQLSDWIRRILANHHFEINNTLSISTLPSKLSIVKQLSKRLLS